jgi:polar amino acid transport system substrate-binding protein
MSARDRIREHSMTTSSLSKLGVLLFSLALAACATAPTASSIAKSELAPQGKVRVGLLSYNPAFVTQGTPPGELKGIAVDFGRRLATQLGVPFEPVHYNSVAEMLHGVKTGEWDVAMLAIDPARFGDMEFTPAYMELESTYLVAPGSAIRSASEVERGGTRVAVLARSTQENFLKSTLKSGVVMLPSKDMKAALQELATGKADAVLANRSQLVDLAAQLPGARLLDETVTAFPVGVAVPKGKAAAAAYATQLVRYLRDNGAVADSIGRASLPGARVPVEKKTSAY